MSMSMLQPCLSGSMPSFPFKRTVLVCCASSQQSHVALVNGPVLDARVPERTEIRFGLPSKGRMASDTLDLLKDCQLSMKQVNPRQYVAQIPQLANLEVWFQRPKDIVRKLVSGDLDLGIVGFDTVSEYGQGNEDLILVHDALEYGDCHLSLAAVLAASRKALIQRKGALDITQEILERLEARFEGCWSAGIIWTAGVHDCGKLSWEKKSD